MITPRLFPADWDSYDVLTALAPEATDYLGIGVQEGNCVAYVVAKNIWINLTLVDTWGREHGGTGRGNGEHVRQRLQQQLRHDGQLTIRSGQSQIEVPNLPGATFDLIYVDGSHEEAAALEDLLNSWLRLRPGGALVVHDIKMDGVWRALLRFADSLTVAGEYTMSVALGTTRMHGTAVLWRTI